ncbi:serine protease [Candidatus Cyanaurora vandensis]|uniref:trypsin-like serine peptidase n=1 Tax=Candidatus Cyanaurora vandensis TaxID=2714958 RepID=UPI002580E561|nr:trypsin-like serine protease [Candidatus Cyanaurora vandensis]
MKAIRLQILMLSMGIACALPALAQQNVRQQGGVTTITTEAQEPAFTVRDYINARPLPLPRNPNPPPNAIELPDLDAVRDLLPSTPGFSAGAQGAGRTNPTLVPKSGIDEDEVGSEEFGTSLQPFSTAKADLSGLATNTYYPYRAAGKLFFRDGNSSFICSASLIKRGLVVTAAHCVSAYGQKRFYTSIQFIPGYRNGAAPYGTWNAASTSVLSSYFNGTDSCSTTGIVCVNDVATVRLSPQNNVFPGTNTGWYGYGWNGFGFTSTANNGLTHVSQLGYPAGLDSALYMARNDSQGFVNSSQSSNTIIGSLMNGGSSGGPWLINLGIRPTLSGISSGTYPNSNTVVGVTSWGYTNQGIKQQGASPFKDTNIVTLVNTLCGNPVTQAACL